MRVIQHSTGGENMKHSPNANEGTKPLRTVCFFPSREEHKEALENAKRFVLDYYLQDDFSDWIIVTE